MQIKRAEGEQSNQYNISFPPPIVIVLSNSNKSSSSGIGKRKN